MIMGSQLILEDCPRKSSWWAAVKGPDFGPNFSLPMMNPLKSLRNLPPLMVSWAHSMDFKPISRQCL